MKGRRAVFVFSDGRDEGSALNFEHALEIARASRVPIYTVGLVSSKDPPGAPERLEHLARETGARSFVVGSAGSLASIWTRAHRELRSQYLLAYQSSQGEGSREYRRVRVEMVDPELEARTMRGYYP